MWWVFWQKRPSGSAEINSGASSRGQTVTAQAAARTPQALRWGVSMESYWVELNVMITWAKSYYVARKHGSMQARFTFEAMPGHSYGAVFNVKDSSAKIISLDAG